MLIQNEVSVLTLLWNTGIVAKIVLFILLIFSIWSWGIILSKVLLFRKVNRETDDFWRIFRKGQNLSEISMACETLRFTPLVPVFNSGMEILQPRTAQPQGGIAVKTVTSISTLQRAMQRTAAAQLTALEDRLPFLATTAAVAPFVGLFGTVWGVMTSFTGLANSGSSSLAAVAPGIADALIATAFGLFAAIPAVIAYNQLGYRVRNIGGQLDDLQADMLAIGEGNGL